MRRDRVLPSEVCDDVVRDGLGDGPRLALLVLDRRLDLRRHLVGIDLGRAFVQRPEVLVDADVDHQAFVERFDRPRGRLRLLLHRLGPEQGHERHPCFGRLDGGNAREAEGGFARVCIDRRRIGGRRGRGRDGRRAELAMGRRHRAHGGYGTCQQRADRPGVSARHARAAGRRAVPDRRCGILDPRPLEAANSRRCAQQRQRKPSRSRHRSPPPVRLPKARRTAGTR